MLAAESGQLFPEDVEQLARRSIVALGVRQVLVEEQAAEVGLAAGDPWQLLVERRRVGYGVGAREF